MAMRTKYGKIALTALSLAGEAVVPQAQVAGLPDALESRDRFVSGRGAMERFLSDARRRRCHVVFHGDSNRYVGAASAGWVTTLPLWWDRFVGSWAGPCKPPQSQGAYEFDALWLNHGGQRTADTAGVPASHRRWLHFHSDAQSVLWWPADMAGVTPGMPLTAAAGGSPYRLAATELWYQYGTFAGGAGRFRPTAWLGFGPFKDYGSGPYVDTNTGADGLAVGHLDVPPVVQFVEQGATRGFALAEFDADPTVKGPVLVTYAQVVHAGVNAGVAFTDRYSAGGEPTRSIALTMAGETQDQFDAFMQIVAATQLAPGNAGGEPVVCVQIVQGANDTNDPLPSVGPNPAPGNTIAGMIDNTRALIAHYRQRWAACGPQYKPRNLYFMHGPYYPQEATRGQWWRDAKAAFRAYAAADPQFFAVHGSEASTTADYVARGYYLGGGTDEGHLASQAAYAYAVDTAMDGAAAGAVEMLPRREPPARGGPTLYVDAADGRLKFKSAAGVVSPLT